ncbi:hypothetical protein C2E21_7199 [Chlorella sorokiniana]|uniref:Uncharacterized protein n=1 Tax=Chlorella sorokiniana TaxID=3076 RepID=A0A2P6TI38_CHLSO|nr:hypothetical protein C2E21_7199 [Chlorella sorokiniana]|eukprot:PRW33964.1 hypothetical protein C2E21_7199 [Chlorella sorokiniana]
MSAACPAHDPRSPAKRPPLAAPNPPPAAATAQPPPLLPLHLQHAVHQALTDLQAQRLLYPQQCAAAEAEGASARQEAQQRVAAALGPFSYSSALSDLDAARQAAKQLARRRLQLHSPDEGGAPAGGSLDPSLPSPAATAAAANEEEALWAGFETFSAAVSAEVDRRIATARLHPPAQAAARGERLRHLQQRHLPQQAAAVAGPAADLPASRQPLGSLQQQEARLPPTAAVKPAVAQRKRERSPQAPQSLPQAVPGGGRKEPDAAGSSGLQRMLADLTAALQGALPPAEVQLQEADSSGGPGGLPAVLLPHGIEASVLQDAGSLLQAVLDRMEGMEQRTAALGDGLCCGQPPADSPGQQGQDAAVQWDQPFSVASDEELPDSPSSSTCASPTASAGSGSHREADELLLAANKEGDSQQAERQQAVLDELAALSIRQYQQHAYLAEDLGCRLLAAADGAWDAAAAGADKPVPARSPAALASPSLTASYDAASSSADGSGTPAGSSCLASEENSSLLSSATTSSSLGVGARHKARALRYRLLRRRLEQATGVRASLLPEECGAPSESDCLSPATDASLATPLLCKLPGGGSKQRLRRLQEEPAIVEQAVAGQLPVGMEAAVEAEMATSAAAAAEAPSPSEGSLATLAEADGEAPPAGSPSTAAAGGDSDAERSPPLDSHLADHLSSATPSDCPTLGSRVVGGMAAGEAPAAGDGEERFSGRPWRRISESSCSTLREISVADY